MEDVDGWCGFWVGSGEVQILQDMWPSVSVVSQTPRKSWTEPCSPILKDADR
jgi:hypothetical protein